MPQTNKGDRKAQSVRFPRDHFAVYEERARKAGLSLSDYVVQQLALRHELDVPWWARGNRSVTAADLFGRSA